MLIIIILRVVFVVFTDLFLYTHYAYILCIVDADNICTYMYIEHTISILSLMIIMGKKCFVCVCVCMWCRVHNHRAFIVIMIAIILIFFFICIDTQHTEHITTYGYIGEHGICHPYIHIMNMCHFVSCIYILLFRYMLYIKSITIVGNIHRMERELNSMYYYYYNIHYHASPP